MLQNTNTFVLLFCLHDQNLTITTVLLTLFCLFTGTASRLSRRSSYHHCTLLHSADRAAISTLLHPSCPHIQSNATPSVPSPVTNLMDHAPSLELEELLDTLTQQYNKGASCFCQLNMREFADGWCTFVFSDRQSLASPVHPQLLTRRMSPPFRVYPTWQRSCAAGSGHLVRRLSSALRRSWSWWMSSWTLAALLICKWTWRTHGWRAASWTFQKTGSL